MCVSQDESNKHTLNILQIMCDCENGGVIVVACCFSKKESSGFAGLRSGRVPEKLWSVKRLERLGRVTLRRGSSEALERKVVEEVWQDCVSATFWEDFETNVFAGLLLMPGKSIIRVGLSYQR